LEGFALLVGVIAASVSLSSSRRQHAASLIIAALGHMGGGSQERSAGLAALTALQGRSTGRLRFLTRRVWSTYAPSVGQQLFRQSTYVLTHGRRRFYAHEVENLIAMIDWLTTDRELAFDSAEQRKRLMHAVDTYLAESAASNEAEVKDTDSIAALEQHASVWRTALEHTPDDHRSCADGCRRVRGA
jgi:hypothetical protein